MLRHRTYLVEGITIKKRKSTKTGKVYYFVLSGKKELGRFKSKRDAEERKEKAEKAQRVAKSRIKKPEIESLKDKIVKAVENGLHTARKISEEVDKSEAQVNRYAHQLVKVGKLKASKKSKWEGVSANYFGGAASAKRTYWYYELP